MARRQQIEADANLLANILQELASQTAKGNENGTESSLKTKVISFKDKFSLNYVNLGAKNKVFVEGLEDVFGEAAFGDKNYLLIVSNEVENVPNGINDSDGYFNESEQLTENILSGMKEKNPQSSNKISISAHLVVKTGPTSGSAVEFITGKVQLQSASCTTLVQTVKTESLEALELKDARFMVTIFVQAILKLKENLNDSETFWDFCLPWFLLKCKSEKPQKISWLCCKMEHAAIDGAKRGILKSFIVNEERSVVDLEESLGKILDDKCEKSLYFARYDLLSSIYKNSGEDSSTLLMELSWQDKTTSSQPPPSSADALVKFRIAPSDPTSPLATRYLELIQLENMVHGTSNATSDIWSDLNEGKNAKKNIVSSLPDFLDGLKTVKYGESASHDKREENDTESFSLSSYVLENLRRKDHDFTDDLWEYLKNAVSLDDIVQALDHIFAAICTREIQPVFNSENKVELAVWIREFYRTANQNEGMEVLKERLDFVLEDESKVLELVAKLGLEKYKRDYIAFFVSEELATFGQLQPVLKHEASVKESMLMIWKLHHCLELVAAAIMYLKLPVDYVRMILKASLDYYKATDDLSSTPTFSVSIPSVSSASAPAIQCCSTSKPLLWKCSANVIGRGHLKMFISSEDREASSNLEDDLGTLSLHKVVGVSESSVRIY